MAVHLISLEQYSTGTDNFLNVISTLHPQAISFTFVLKQYGAIGLLSQQCKAPDFFGVSSKAVLVKPSAYDSPVENLTFRTYYMPAFLIFR